MRFRGRAFWDVCDLLWDGWEGIEGGKGQGHGLGGTKH